MELWERKGTNIYTTQLKLEAYLGRELTDNEALIIDDVISYISSFIDSYTNRSWQSLGDEDDEDIVEPTERMFDGINGRELFVDDFTDLESIKLYGSDGSLINEFSQPTDWILYPLNSSIKSSIRLRSYGFPSGNGSVAVTAVWGSGSIPPDVAMVATALVAGYLINSGDVSGAYIKESIEGYSYELAQGTSQFTEQQQLLSTLDRHRKFIL